LPTAASAQEYLKEYVHGLSVGLEAYVYGEPLLNMQRTFQTNTSVTVPDQIGDAPVNQFSHLPTPLAEARAANRVHANGDTLTSVAWLQLTPSPIVLHVPASPGRFSNVPLYSPYEENFANVGEGASGQLPPGNYVIAGPGQLAGKAVVQGLTVIHSPYKRVLLLPRTLVRGKEDVANAAAIQAEMQLVPLNLWKEQGLNYKPPAPEVEITQTTVYRVPGTRLGEDPLAYWTALGAALEQFKPPAADTPELQLLQTVGIGPGLSPANNTTLGPGTVAGLRAAVLAGPREVRKAFQEIAQASVNMHNGWIVSSTGSYGTNYRLRAVVDKSAFGAQTPNIAVYPLATADRNGVSLSGENRYVAHFPASDFPVPVEAFWSLTIYSTTWFFHPNTLKRHTLDNRSNLHFEEDGSLNIYLQAAEPTNEIQRGNWLPSPGGHFELMLRLYGLDEAAIAPLLEGAPGSWTPPTILPCLPTGETATGWHCAT
jgi:DNA sulfur modification protein DndE